MKLRRGQFLHLAAAAAAVPALPHVAIAQAYPTRPVRLILGYGAGGAPDICGDAPRCHGRRGNGLFWGGGCVAVHIGVEIEIRPS